MSIYRILLPFSFLLLTLSGAGQHMVVDGATWTIQHTYQTDYGGPVISYDELLLSGQKQLGGTTYHQLYLNGNLRGFLREEGEKVYFRYAARSPVVPDTSEFLLYDFGIGLDDTLNLRFDLRWSSYITKYLRFRVVSIDSISTVGGPKRKFTLYNIDSDTTFLPNPLRPIFWLCERDTLEWIEDIGSTIGLNYSYYGVNCHEGWSWFSYEVVCHSKKGNLIYQPYGSCDSASLGMSSFSAGIHVFPNPSDGAFSVQLPEGLADAHLEMYDVSGALVFSASVGQRQSRFVPAVPKGLYFLTLKRGGSMLHSEKILIR